MTAILLGKLERYEEAAMKERAFCGIFDYRMDEYSWLWLVALLVHVL